MKAGILRIRKVRNMHIWVIKRGNHQVGPYFGSKELAVKRMVKVRAVDFARLTRLAR